MYLGHIYSFSFHSNIFLISFPISCLFCLFYDPLSPISVARVYIVIHQGMSNLAMPTSSQSQVTLPLISQQPMSSLVRIRTPGGLLLCSETFSALGLVEVLHQHSCCELCVAQPCPIQRLAFHRTLPKCYSCFAPSSSVMFPEP